MRLAHGVLQSVPGVVGLPQVGPTRRDAAQVPSVVQQVPSRPMHGASGSYLYHVVMHIQVPGAVQRRPTWCRFVSRCGSAAYIGFLYNNACNC